MRRLIILWILFLILSFWLFTEAIEKNTIGPESADFYKKWTGDLDGMVKRRVIRVLTVYNKTLYFLDKDTQRGIVYDGMKMFEDQLNKKLKTGNLKIHVVFF